MSVELLTVAEVAALVRHPAPESAAAARLVSRLVAAGLPRIDGLRPARFVRVHVLAWLEEYSRPKAPPSRNAGPPTKTRKRARKGGPTRPGMSALDEEIQRLRELA